MSITTSTNPRSQQHFEIDRGGGYTLFPREIGNVSHVVDITNQPAVFVASGFPATVYIQFQVSADRVTWVDWKIHGKPVLLSLDNPLQWVNIPGHYRLALVSASGAYTGDEQPAVQWYPATTTHERNWDLVNLAADSPAPPPPPQDISIPITSGEGALDNTPGTPTVYTDTLTGKVYYRDNEGVVLGLEDPTYIQLNALAVERTRISRLRQGYHILDFKISSDWNLTVERMLESGERAVNVGDLGEVYNLETTFLVKTPVTLHGHWARFKQHTANTPLFVGAGLKAYKLIFEGLGTDFDNTDTSQADALRLLGEGNGVLDCEFYGFSHSAATVFNTVDLQWERNKVVCLGAGVIQPITHGRNYGLLLIGGTDGGITNTLAGISQDWIPGGRMTGTRIVGGSISLGGNGFRAEGEIHDSGMCGTKLLNTIGQHAFYSGSGVKNMVVDGVYVLNPRLVGIKAQLDQAKALDDINNAPKGFKLVNSTIIGAGSHGVLVAAGADVRSKPYKDVYVAGNTINDSGEAALQIQNVTNGRILNNYGNKTGKDFIRYLCCNNLLISGNQGENLGGNGINDGYNSADPGDKYSYDVTVKDNNITNWGQNGNDEYSDAYLFFATKGLVLDNNTTTVDTETAAKGPDGVTLLANSNRRSMSIMTDPPTTTITNNTLNDATSGALCFPLPLVGALREYSNNTTNRSALLQGILPVASGVDLASYPGGEGVVLPPGLAAVEIISAPGAVMMSIAAEPGRLVTLYTKTSFNISSGSNNIEITGTTPGNNFLVEPPSLGITLLCRQDAGGVYRWYGPV